MINDPNQDMQEFRPPSGKLILPAPPEQGAMPPNPHTLPIWPVGQPMQGQYAPPPQPQGFLARRWRKDPAYLVFSLAIALVLVATVVFAAFGANTVLNNNRLASSQKPAVSTPAPTPTSQPTPVPSPTSQPTPNPQLSSNQGPLSVQIVNVPDTVNNNSRVHVDVQTNEPGVQVKLRVSYSAAPFFYTSGAHTTDNNGKVSLPWSIKVYSFGYGGVQATVEAIAIDQNGQQAASQPVTVTIQG